MKSYYDILGVTPDATESEIRKAYRNLVKKYHPDVHKDDKIASEMIKEINVAYGVLSDHSKRLIYDYDNGFLHNKNKSKCDEDAQKKRAEEQQRKNQEEQKKREEDQQRKYQEEQKRREEERQRKYQEERQKREEQENKYYEDICLENVKKMQEEQQKKQNKGIPPIFIMLFAMIALCLIIGIWNGLLYDFPSSSHKANTLPTRTPRPTVMSTSTPTPKLVVDMNGTFSLDSAMSKVRKVMGYPDKTLGNQWIYGDSTVTFENQRVNGFINNGELRVSLGDRIDGATFTKESMIDDVIKAMGTPDKVWDDVWYYGSSTVTVKGGRVVEYVDNGELRMEKDSNTKPTATPKPTKKPKPTATLKPTATPEPTATPRPTVTPKPTVTPEPTATPTTTEIPIVTDVPIISEDKDYNVNNTFTLGASFTDVLDVMGEPDKMSSYRWTYGNSTIDFYNDKVDGYINKGELRVFFGDASDETSFTLDSTTEDVIKAMGTPDEVKSHSGNYGKPAWWRYGNSEVRFFENKVDEYTNAGNLRVFLGDKVADATFTIGSTEQEVLKAMGTPDILKNEKWIYGDSTIYFGFHEVVRYTNKGELHVSLGEAIEGEFFTLGSTKEDVVIAMGTPDEVLSEKWIYGDSTIYFWLNEVDGFTNNGDLRVFFGETSENATFTFGSTTDDVIKAMGTPDEVWNNQWKYGPSTISFSDGKVKIYTNKGNLKLR